VSILSHRAFLANYRLTPYSSGSVNEEGQQKMKRNTWADLPMYGEAYVGDDDPLLKKLKEVHPDGPADVVTVINTVVGDTVVRKTPPKPVRGAQPPRKNGSEPRRLFMPDSVPRKSSMDEETKELISTVYQERRKKQVSHCSRIIERAAIAFDISVAVLTSTVQGKNVRRAQCAAVYAMRSQKYPFASISIALNISEGRVFSNAEQASREMSADPAYAERVAALCAD
jgi:hypothetical protein